MFPECRARSGKVIALTERVNDCFQRSMNGKPLAYDSAETNNILAYMQWLSTGVSTIALAPAIFRGAMGAGMVC